MRLLFCFLALFTSPIYAQTDAAGIQQLMNAAVQKWVADWAVADENLDFHLQPKRELMVKTLATYLTTSQYPAKQIVILDEVTPHLGQSVNDLVGRLPEFFNFTDPEGFNEFVLAYREANPDQQAARVLRHIPNEELFEDFSVTLPPSQDSEKPATLFRRMPSELPSSSTLGETGLTYAEIKPALIRALKHIEDGPGITVLKIPMIYLNSTRTRNLGADLYTRYLPDLIAERKMKRLKIVYSGKKESWRLLTPRVRWAFNRLSERKDLMIFDMGKLQHTRYCEDVLKKYN